MKCFGLVAAVGGVAPRQTGGIESAKTGEI